MLFGNVSGPKQHIDPDFHNGSWGVPLGKRCTGNYIPDLWLETNIQALIRFGKGMEAEGAISAAIGLPGAICRQPGPSRPCV